MFAKVTLRFAVWYNTLTHDIMILTGLIFEKTLNCMEIKKKELIKQYSSLYSFLLWSVNSLDSPKLPMSYFFVNYKGISFGVNNQQSIFD